jgi:uncharacterized membrane protein
LFDQIHGLPVHALVLHAAVVFVPLLALGAVVYAVVGSWRSRIAWAVALLAVITPITTLVAKLSGQELYNRLVAQGLKGKGKEILDSHMGFGTRTFWFSLALGVVCLIAVALTARKSSSLPKPASWGLAIIMIVLAAISGYYVFRTGDSGATAVWGQY